MKILYYRNTHDENENYRGDDYFGKPNCGKELEDYEKQELFFGVHTFEGDKGMTFEELFENTHKMLTDGSYEGDISDEDERLSISSHLRGLAFMIEHNLVKIEFNYE